MVQRHLPYLVLLATVLAVFTWSAPRPPLASPDCSAGPSTPVFCASVPTSAPETLVSMSLVDQVRPCTERAASGPSFCVALPTPAPSADLGELLAQRRDTCAKLEAGEAPDFCLVVPAGGASTAGLQRDIALALLRQRLGTEFRRTAASGVQLWTEVGVSGPIVDGALRLVIADSVAVQDHFGRSYQQPPAVFLFMSHQSFSLAMQRHFGVDPAVAAQLSRQLLGVLLTGSDAVAINGESIVTSGRPVVYRHELAHVLIHQLAGDGIPAWFDEGLATRVSALDPAVIDPARAGAIAALRSDRRALSIFTDRRDWQSVNSAFGGRAYGVAAEAVLEVERRVGRNGVTTLLEALGHGVPFEDAFRAAVGETLDDFIARLPSIVHLGSQRDVSYVADALMTGSSERAA